MRERFHGRHVGIWGFRAEGVAALDFVQQFGPSKITIADDKGLKPRWNELDSRGKIPIVGPFAGADAAQRLRECDIVVKSAGVSRYLDLALELMANGIPLVGGMQLFFEAMDPRRLIAVTGTKGKSTTATAIHRIVMHAGRDAVLLGNMGEPVLGGLGGLLQNDALCVLEVSSYQAAEVTRSPAFGCFTSLHPDHLDWHRSFDRYVADKVNLFGHPAPTTELHVGPQLRGHPVLAGLPVDLRPYGDSGAAIVDDDRLLLDGHEITSGGALKIAGRHNLINLCGAVSVASSVVGSAGVGSSAEFCRAAALALESLEPLRDRLEVVRVVAGVSYMLDALATIPQATIAALDAHADRPLVLIAGGFDRGQDYGELAAVIARSPNVRAVVGLPDTGRRLAQQVRDAVTGLGGDSGLGVLDADDLPDAVSLAASTAEPGTTVLLSPAAASFNKYVNYEDLSADYRAIVDALPDGDDKS
jgi:UDP-N-acetylmuramoylalanine--D-glutamate ligase